VAEPLHRVLILDTDPDTLITLQGVFGNAEIDTTVTWDKAEAYRLIETAPYDLLLIAIIHLNWILQQSSRASVFEEPALQY
jgi:CheY-like chemotaxis protein